MKGEARALDGVPGTIKENLAVKGLPMPLGTAAAISRRWRRMRRRRRDGGSRFHPAGGDDDAGITACCPRALSSFHKLARNPWDTTRNPRLLRPGPGPRARPAMAPCMSAPISRLDPAAGGLVRSRRPQAEFWPGCRSIRLLRPRRRADDAPRRGRRPDDARVVAARLRATA